MFDTRTNTSVISVEHGQPVESVLLFPSGGLLVSAGISFKNCFHQYCCSWLIYFFIIYFLLFCLYVLEFPAQVFLQTISKWNRQLSFIDYLMWAKHCAIYIIFDALMSLQGSWFSPCLATKEINKCFNQFVQDRVVRGSSEVLEFDCMLYVLNLKM